MGPGPCLGSSMDFQVRAQRNNKTDNFDRQNVENLNHAIAYSNNRSSQGLLRGIDLCKSEFVTAGANYQSQPEIGKQIAS